VAKGKDFSGLICHFGIRDSDRIAFGSYTKGCVAQFKRSRASQTNLAVAALCAGVAGRLIGASHSEAAAVQKTAAARIRAAAEFVSRKR
jgi:hypothetical protein